MSVEHSRFVGFKFENELVTVMTHISAFEAAVTSALRPVPDFPIKGVTFRDISPLLLDPVLMNRVAKAIARNSEDRVDKVMGMDARGFLFAPLVAQQLDAGVVMARKPSKLPGDKIAVEYGKEYGKDSLEIIADTIKPGERVLVVDDILATGGTAAAAGKLVRAAGGVVAGYAFVAEIAGLGGRANLTNPYYRVYACVSL